MMKAMYLLCLITFLSGCTSWPDNAGGGLAERHVVIYEPENPNKLMENADKSLELKINNAGYKLKSLDTLGARLCFPADIHKADAQYARTQREYVSGLHIDAERDLTILNKQLKKIQSNTQQIQDVSTCKIKLSSINK